MNQSIDGSREFDDSNEIWHCGKRGPTPERKKERGKPPEGQT